MVARKANDEEFAKRFNSACDQNPHCPALHYGRLQWVSDQFKAKFDEKMSIETVRKWTQGEAIPRQANARKVAEVLGVDPTWLLMGADNALTTREKRARNAVADGAVNVLAGMIQIDGGVPAFPAEDGPVDIHAIIRGAKYDIHTVVGDMKGEDAVFAIPADANYEAITVIGMLRDGFSFRPILLEHDYIQEGERKGGSIRVSLPQADVAEWEIKSFKERL